MSHLREFKVAAASESIAAIRTAITSAEVDGGLSDLGGDGDYLDDLVAREKLDKNYIGIPGSNTALKKTVENDTVVYCRSIQCLTDECRKVVSELDSEFDNSDGPATGAAQRL